MGMDGQGEKGWKSRTRGKRQKGHIGRDKKKDRDRKKGADRKEEKGK